MADFPLVCLGISTGGPKTLRKLITDLPQLPLAMVIVQHMPKFINAGMARSLADNCGLDARVVERGMELEPGCIYIAPSEVHTELVGNRRFQLQDDPPVCFVRPSADVLMRSVAAEKGRRLVGIVMTGMGSDGAEGLRHMKSVGALTAAQDRGSSVVYGMPRAAYETGCVDHVLDIGGLRRLLLATTRR